MKGKTDEELREMVFQYIKSCPEAKSSELSDTIEENESIKLSDHQIRAYKYWYRKSQEA